VSALVRQVETVTHFLHDRLVWVLMGAYFAAAVCPGPGLALRNLSLGTVRAKTASIELGAPTLLLELLLFNAALGINAAEVTRLMHRVRIVGLGLFANSALPLCFTLLAAVVLSRWHDSDEVQSLLVGLAFIGAMPIAGSSTTWSQNAAGNVALSLGLVLASTMVSPSLTPLQFHIVSHVTTGDYSEDLAELAGGSTELFLVLAVVVPSVLGMLVRALLRPARVARALPFVKLANTVTLIVLNYINAAAALPGVLRRPDADYLALVFGVTAVLCTSAFALGSWIGGLAGAHQAERTSLMFGLGMNNNGSGLVLASTTMADHPNVLLTIVAYNLVQQVVAGIADHWVARRHAAA